MNQKDIKPRKHGTDYNTVHQWMLRHYKKIGVCESCKKETKTQWSHKTHKYFEERDRVNWQELCPKCHNKYDAKVLGVKMGSPKGGKHISKGLPNPLARFTDSQVREIRKLRVLGMKYKDIANKYGVVISIIHKIVSGKGYKWVK